MRLEKVAVRLTADAPGMLRTGDELRPVARMATAAGVFLFMAARLARGGAVAE